jgi:serine/threonine-protein kinase RsbW
MGGATTVKISIPSEVKLVDLVHEASQKMAELAGFEEGDALNVGIAVREAVINAIVHGNQRDPSRNVDVTLEAGESGVKAMVLDRGPGFDVDATPDPRQGDNLLKTSGRGLLMIRAFVDKVAFKYRKGRGLEITLVKEKRTPS